MTRILIYGRHNTFAWWRHIGSRLGCGPRPKIVSEFPGEGDIEVMPEFYAALGRRDCREEALTALGPLACDEIIARCRLLRSLERSLAIEMIGGMWLTMNSILEREAPDLVVSFMIDYYVLDILERALRRRGLPYIGLVSAVLDGRMMFSARGEFHAVRTPGDGEVEEAVATITSPGFAPFLSAKRTYRYSRFLKSYFFYHARSAGLKAVRAWRRDPLNFHYLATRENVPEYRVRLGDWRLMRYLDRDWEAQMDATPFEKRVFIGLQTNPEASIDYWVEDAALIRYREVLEQLATTLASAGFRIFLKDHPNSFGARPAALYDRLSRIGNVVFIPYEVSSQCLIDRCRTTFTWTGTIGLQSALAGRCSVVTNPYYAVDGYFVQVRSAADLAELPQRIDGFSSPSDLAVAQRQLTRHMLGGVVPGDTASWPGFRDTDTEAVARVEPLIRSLNEHLPLLAKMHTSRVAPAAQR